MPKRKRQSKGRRGKGDGSIYQRQDGKWVGVLEVGKTASGNRRRRYVYGETRGEARNKLDDLRQKHAEGTLTDPDKTTMAAFLSRFLDHIKRQRKSGTHVEYSRCVNQHILPVLGGTLVKDVTPLVLEDSYSQMEKNGTPKPTLKTCHAVLSSAFKSAIRWQLRTDNPCQNVPRPKAARKQIEPYTRDQVRQLLEATADTRWHALITLAITTGMRAGELLGLPWRNVDLGDEPKVVVLQQARTKSGRHWIDELKTESSRRTILLTEAAAVALRDHRAELLKEGLVGSEWAFPSTRGTIINPSNLRLRGWHPALKKAGLPIRKFHNTRHTAATLMLQAGVNPKVVQIILGHASIITTLDTYGHVLPDMQQDCVEKMDRLLA